MIFINMNLQNSWIMYKNKTLPTLLMNFFDDVKNDLNLNTRSRTREKLKVPLFK